MQCVLWSLYALHDAQEMLFWFCLRKQTTAWINPAAVLAPMRSEQSILFYDDREERKEEEEEDSHSREKILWLFCSRSHTV